MHFLIWCLFVIAFGGAPAASGQQITMPKEGIGNPTSKPEPRRLIATDPISLYRRLLSTSLQDRKDAFRMLAHDEIDADDPVEARLYAVNLDSDSDLEYILVATGHFPPRTFASVFDRAGESWWVIGDFSYWWHWGANEAEQLIGLREIVRNGRKEITVRDWSGGTGVTETWLSIYRMQNGYLYRVFRTLEDGFHFIVGAGTSEYEHRTLEYPDHDWNAPALLVARHLKRTEPSRKGLAFRLSRNCSVFRWDSASFSFVEDKAAMPNLCSNHAPGSSR
jgi:hypothetical protein